VEGFSVVADFDWNERRRRRAAGRLEIFAAHGVNNARSYKTSFLHFHRKVDIIIPNRL